MKLKNYPSILLLLLITISAISCNKETIIPEIKESYHLSVLPEMYKFPAFGGEVSLEITATKNITTISQGDTLDNQVLSVPYSISISGEAFSITENIISAEINTGGRRESTVKVSIDGTGIEKIINLTQEGIEDKQEDEVLVTHVKVLAIGNSFSADALEFHLSGLAEANGDTIIIGNMYIAGASLKTHYNNARSNSSNYSYRKIVKGTKTVTDNVSLKDAIKDEEWDYIAFQQTSASSGIYETYFPYLTSLTEYVKEYANSNIKFILHATWAYAQNSTHDGFSHYGNHQMIMFNAIIDASQRAAKTTGIETIIPTGTAIQNGRSSKLGDTFCSDGYHLEHSYGRYTASCTWYEILFNKSVISNTFLPSSMNEFQAEVAQYAASFAVANPFKVTSLASFQEENNIDVPFLSRDDY